MNLISIIFGVCAAALIIFGISQVKNKKIPEKQRSTRVAFIIIGIVFLVAGIGWIIIPSLVSSGNFR